MPGLEVKTLSAIHILKIVELVITIWVLLNVIVPLFKVQYVL